MAKFSVNVPDEYNELLERWAEELGDKRGSLGGRLIEMSLEKKFPNELPSPPDELPGDTPYELPEDIQLRNWVTMAIHLGGDVSTPAAFAATSMRGHFSRWLSNYRQRLLELADNLEVTFPEAFTLVTQRKPPYSQTDLKWVRAQKNTMTEERFLGHLPRPGTAPSLNPESNSAIIE